jgi:hypothetical protein
MPNHQCGLGCGNSLNVTGITKEQVRVEAHAAGWMSIIGESVSALICPECIPKAERILAKRSSALPPK